MIFKAMRLDEMPFAREKKKSYNIGGKSFVTGQYLWVRQRRRSSKGDQERTLSELEVTASRSGILESKQRAYF